MKIAMFNIAHCKATCVQQATSGTPGNIGFQNALLPKICVCFEDYPLALIAKFEMLYGLFLKIILVQLASRATVISRLKIAKLFSNDISCFLLHFMCLNFQ